MAATITFIAESSNPAAGGIVLTLTGGGDLVVGDWYVFLAALSNDGTNGASAFTGFAKSTGTGAITLTDRANINYDPGAAGAGANLCIGTGVVTTAGTYQVAALYSPDVSEGCIQAFKVAPGAGETISFVAVDATGSTGNATSHSAATVSVTSGDMIFAAAAIETDDTITGDSDTTNGNWSTVETTLDDNGADASTMTLAEQHKTVNATGNQDWACTTATGRDSARTYLILRSVGGAFTIAADAGSYSITGSAATVKAGRKIAADAGAYSISGSAAALVHGYKLAADAGGYAITGSAAGLSAGRKIAADAGVYGMTGFAAGLKAGRRVAADSGVYSLSGAAAGLKAGRRIAADAGAYAINGFAATLIGPVGAFTIAADAGSYAVTGSAAALRAARRIAAEPGAYAIIGADASLIFGSGSGAAVRNLLLLGVGT